MKRNDIDKPTLTEPRLYTIVRRDLYDLTPGKLGAQTGHAATKFVFDILDLPENQGSRRKAALDEWRQAGDGGFGTKITLYAVLNEMHATKEFMDTLGVQCGMVVDTSYPFRTQLGEVFTAVETTCMYVFAQTDMPQEALDYLRKFPLHP